MNPNTWRNAAAGGITVTAALLVAVLSSGSPRVNAGDAAIVTATTAHTLAAGCSDDGDPDPPGALVCTWSQTVGTGCAFTGDVTDFACTSNASPDVDVTCDESEAATLRLCCDDDGAGENVAVCDTVVITAHTAPTVGAGDDDDASIDVPLALNGTCTDDALPNAARTCTWAQTTGSGCVFAGDPTDFACDDATDADLEVTCSAAESAVLTLTCSDGALSDDDTVTITISAAPVVPTVNAGTDVAAAAPLSTGTPHTFAALCSDDGQPAVPGVLTCGWTVSAGCTLESGADLFECDDAADPDFDVTCSTTGTKTATLCCDDESDVPTDGVCDAMTIASNTAPSSVNAGADAAAETAVAEAISCSASDDGLPNPPAAVSYAWTKTSGPGSCVFGNAALASTTATCDAAGSVVLTCTASDSIRTTPDTVTLTVVSNVAPSVNAGADDDATVSVAHALNATCSDDGLPSAGSLSCAWTQTAGSGSCSFEAGGACTCASNDCDLDVTCDEVDNDYALRLTCSDGALSANDSMILDVLPENDPPSVAAGSDVPASAPQSSGSAYTFAASCSDDGLPDPPAVLTCGWTASAGCTLESGADDFTCDDNADPDFDVTCTTTGAKTLELCCDDASDVPASGECDALTLYSNTAPSSVNAGSDADAEVGVAEAISCSASDDGLPNPPAAVSYAWTKQSGPGGCTFGNAALASTTATCDAEGSVVLRCTASDSVRTATDDVTLTVESGALDATAVARWLFDDASSGTTPTTANDSVGSVDMNVNGPITYNGSANHWTSTAQGDAFLLADPDDSITIDNVDATAINWDTLTTWGLELNLTLTGSQNVDIFLMRGFSGRQAAVSRISGVLRVYWDDDVYLTFTDVITGAGRGTLYLQYNTGNGTAADRVRLYWQGTRLTSTGNVGGNPTSGAYVDCPSDCEAWVMAHGSTHLHAAAWYESVVSDSDIDAISDAYVISNDTDPTQ